MRLPLVSFVFLSLALVIFSCQADPTSSHPLISQMEDRTKSTLDKSTYQICQCLYEHPTKEMLKTAKDIITAQDNQQKGIENYHLLQPVLSGMKELKACMEGTGINAADNVVLQRDLKKLLSSDAKEAEAQKLDITVSFLKKNCPGHSRLYADFINTVQLLRDVLATN